MPHAFFCSITSLLLSFALSVCFILSDFSPLMLSFYFFEIFYLLFLNLSQPDLY